MGSKNALSYLENFHVQRLVCYSMWPLSQPKSLAKQAYLVCESVHDDMIRDKTKRVDLFHEDVSRDFVEMDELQKIANNLFKVSVGLIVAVFFGPH